MKEVPLTTLAIVLIIFSALTHALWNSLGKRSAISVSFYIWASAFGFLAFSPLLLFTFPKLNLLPVGFWGLLLVSGMFQSMYLSGLAMAYRSGDLSLVYPLLRSFPVLFVPLCYFLIYGQSSLGWVDSFAMLLIVLGAVLIPMTKHRSFSVKDYFNATMAWTSLAVVGTVGYSLVDSAAIGIMTQSGWSSFEAGSSYAILQCLSILLFMVPVVTIVFKEKIEWPAKPLLMFATGFTLVGTYLIVLVAMSMVVEVSYLVAMRQLSIPIGVIIGVLYFKERLGLYKLIGLMVMCVALVLVSV